MRHSVCLWVLAAFWFGCQTPVDTQKEEAREPHRPLIHFTPPEKWMNDPNGMVFHKGTWHLFYQYYPDSTVWGPMHWGHATSTDLLHWEHKPVALYPDSLGWIFSGSAVVDVNNTAGFAPAGDTALVAIFTHHGHDSSVNKKEVQSLAYSLDNGNTWVKYAGNPVLPNYGINDFRDPKVFWYASGNKWMMTLAVKDHVEFYSSPNLKEWQRESSFGADRGAHGGVWECPDLVSFDHEGKKIWVLIVNINPGGPNGGSATQYFTGDFDGKNFTPNHTDIRWIDYGPDEYAGVTWSNTGSKTYFMGWMSNWLYANKVPTLKWRSAMTLPRELRMETVNGQYYVASRPVAALEQLHNGDIKLPAIPAKGASYQASANLTLPAVISLKGAASGDISLAFSNDAGEILVAGYHAATGEYFIDRTAAGDSSFFSGFGARHKAPRISRNEMLDLKLIADVSSLELFADDGLSVMTSIFFPKSPYNKLEIKGNLEAVSAIRLAATASSVKKK